MSSFQSIADLAIDGLGSFRLFAEQDYYNMHPDVRVAGGSAREHAVLWGAGEGRSLFKESVVAKALNSASFDAEIPPEDKRDSGSSKSGVVNIFVSSVGNVFMKEIAADLAADLLRSGVVVSVFDEWSKIELRHGVNLFIAPHEFFYLGRGSRWLQRDIIRRSYVYNTEQLQTSWFARALPIVLAARGVVDISAQNASILRESSKRAFHYEPAPNAMRRWLNPGDEDHPLIRAMPRSVRAAEVPVSDWERRPIDVSFVGSESARRGVALARCASTLARYQTYIYYRSAVRGPIKEGFNEGALTRIGGHIAQLSKISLNIHRDEFPYFEWHRMARSGMASGSLVVTDECLSHPVYKKGVHFLEENARHIPDLIDWILNEESGRATALDITNNAYLACANQFGDQRRAAALLRFMVVD